MTVLAWHGDGDLKTATVRRMIEHRAADEIAAGAYLVVDDDNRMHGCFHGCLTAESVAAERGMTLHDLDTADNAMCSREWHDETERLYGIPADLGDVLDYWFEELNHDHGRYAVETLEAIPVGADLTTIDAGALHMDIRAAYGNAATEPAEDDAVITTMCAALAAAPIGTPAALAHALLAS